MLSNYCNIRPLEAYICHKVSVVFHLAEIYTIFLGYTLVTLENTDGVRTKTRLKQIQIWKIMTRTEPEHIFRNAQVRICV